MMDMFIILIMMMDLQMYTYIETHKIVYFKYTQSSCYSLAVENPISIHDDVGLISDLI